MNTNEVIANRAIELLGGDRFHKEKPVHPNDHVNMGQSTNDIFPTAIHVAVAMQIQQRFDPGARAVSRSARSKGTRVGPDHQDRPHASGGRDAAAAGARDSAVLPGRLEMSIDRARRAIEAILELPAGGTAVGTGINTHPEFGRRVAEVLANEAGLAFIEAKNHFEANAQRDGLVECHGQLRTIAVTLFNVSNNIRWLGSGPRCGFYEVKLPDRQPGSSIMPGKVNPVMCESMMQVAARVIGNDQTVAYSGATGGQFQLNIMMPVMGQTTLESVRLLASATRAFVDFCAIEMEANPEACEASVEKSLAMVTSLNPYIGYENAAKMAKEAFATGRTIRELCREEGVLPEATLREALDPMSMTEPRP